MKKIIALVCLLALISLPVYAKKDAAWVIKKAKTTEDKIERTKSINFPVIKYVNLNNNEICEMTGKSKWGMIPNVVYNIRATEGESGVLTFTLMAVEDRTNWAFYKSAKDGDGNEMKLIRPSGDVSSSRLGVNVKEYFNIPLTKTYLENHRESGMVFRAYGDKENVTFHVPAYYVDGVLKYFEEEK